MKTPIVMQKTGMTPLKILMRVSKLRKIIYQDHPDVDVDILKGLPNAMADPIAILQSNTVIGRPIIILELTTKNGNIIVPIELGGTINHTKGNIAVNAYPKGDNGKISKSWYDKRFKGEVGNTPLYLNEKKSPSGTQPTGSNCHRGNTTSVIILMSVYQTSEI